MLKTPVARGRAAWLLVLVLTTLAAVLMTASIASAQQVTVLPSSPALPLFRCDGQRPPMFGADQCANWRLMRKQEQLIDLQLKAHRAQRDPRSPKANSAESQRN